MLLQQKHEQRMDLVCVYGSQPIELLVLCAKNALSKTSQ